MTKIDAERRAEIDRVSELFPGHSHTDLNLHIIDEGLGGKAVAAIGTGMFTSGVIKLESPSDDIYAANYRNAKETRTVSHHPV